MIQRLTAITLLFASSFLSACGGGGGGGNPPIVAPTPPPPIPVVPPAPPPPQPFSVVSTAPENAATGASRTGPFRATFNVSPDANTINHSTVQLLGPLGNAIPVTLSVVGKDITIVPAAAALPGDTRFTVNISQGVKDTVAQQLSASYSGTFATVPQSWDVAANQVAAMPYFTGGVSPYATIDKSGNVTAVWRHQVNGEATIFASRMDHRTGTWATPSVIHSTGPNGDTGLLAVTTDARDNVYVVWTNYADSQESVLMARYVASASKWDLPVPFNPPLPAGVVGRGALIATDGKGIMTVVTLSKYGDGIYATRFDPDAGSWGTSAVIEKPSSDSYVFNVKLEVDNIGNVILGWVQYAPANYGLNVIRYDAKSGAWSAAQVLDNNVTSTPSAIGTDAAGGATIAWTHGQGIMDTPSIVASRFDTATGKWTAPVRISGDGDMLGANRPAIAVDAAGNATVVWEQSRGIYSARSGSLTSTWSPAARVGVAIPGNEAFTLTADIAGNVMLVYVQDGIPIATRYATTEKQWSAPVTIGKPGDGDGIFANSPVSVIDGAGNVTAVWLAQISVSGTARYIVASNRFR